MILALVPTAGMVTFAVQDAMQSDADADAARAVAVEVEDLVQLRELSFVLSDEQLAAQGVLLRKYDLGFTPELVADAFGLDATSDVNLIPTTRRSTDEAFETLVARAPGRLPAIDDLRADVAALRALVDGTHADPGAVLDGYVGAMEVVDEAVVAAQREILATDRLTDPRTIAALRSFVDAGAVATSARHQGFAHADVMLVGETRENLAALVSTTTAYRNNVERLLDVEGSRAAEALRTALAQPVPTRYDATVQDVIDGTSTGHGGSVERFLQKIADGYFRTRLLVDVHRGTADASVESARAAVDRARDDTRAAVGAAAVIGALALASALLAAWSISRPLRLLARWANVLTAGELQAPAPRGRGPREVHTVTRALDEVAGNLRHVAEQNAALAVGALDDPVLARPLPGVLGESVQASVARLSASIREQEALRDRVVEQAHRDLLTGLPNRAGLLTATQHALARAARSGAQIALVSVALDGFKRANDSHGQAFGDEVLRTTAERLIAAARAGDVVARLGGDEFAVLAEPVPGPADAVDLAERLREAVAEPVEGDGRFLRLTASIGVALNQDADDAAPDLLADADQAVQRAKRSGGDVVEMCDEALRRDVAERHEIEAALRTAIVAGELELHYQPVVDTVTGTLDGFEALVRWRRPGHGLVPPMSFIPVAEASDLVVDLGRWVLTEATTQLARWTEEQGLDDVHVAVNVSGRHLLSKGIVDDVRRALADSRLLPERLVVEITETMILSDVDVAVEHLRALRALGVRIALDDFGTGYTSIGQLGRLPLDVLKIDRSFVSELANEQDRSIVELLVEVAHTLDLGLVAEGVEETSQLTELQRLGCDEVQGYLVSRPLPGPDALAFALERPHLGSDSDLSRWLEPTRS